MVRANVVGALLAAPIRVVTTARVWRSEQRPYSHTITVNG